MTRRIRIGSVIADLGFGGSENRLLSFGRTIDRSRFDHVVIVLYRPDECHARQVGSLRPAFAEARIELIELGATPQRRILPSFGPVNLARAGRTLGGIVFRLCRVLREREIDLIDAQHATATLFGVLAGGVTGLPTTITQYFPGYFDRRGMRLLGEAVYRRADAFICDSKAHSDLINQRLRRPHPRSVVIPNGVPKPLVTRSNTEMRRLLALPVDRDAKIVGQVGRLVEYKGQRVLLRAAKEILSAAPETHFLLAGYPNEDATFTDTLKQDARELGIEDRVRIVSWPGSIGDIWEVIDIHVHASRQDSLPIAIAEGMSFGKPAVVTEVGGVREMVTEEETGLVVPMNDSGAIARGVLRLLRDTQTAERLGSAARRRYADRYRPEVMARTLENLFVDLLETRSPVERRAGQVGRPLEVE
jgi:glycosyltransferase involved in cell wall biosynthesis